MHTPNTARHWFSSFLFLQNYISKQMFWNVSKISYVCLSSYMYNQIPLNVFHSTSPLLYVTCVAIQQHNYLQLFAYNQGHELKMLSPYRAGQLLFCIVAHQATFRVWVWGEISQIKLLYFYKCIGLLHLKYYIYFFKYIHKNTLILN
jgi:hypothetical protein